MPQSRRAKKGSAKNLTVCSQTTRAMEPVWWGWWARGGAVAGVAELGDGLFDFVAGVWADPG